MEDPARPSETLIFLPAGWDALEDDLPPPPAPAKPAPWFTLLFIGICFLVWGTTRHLRTNTEWPWRTPAGALWGPLVFSGQWWRLITALFTHQKFSHLFGNSITLLFFGTHIERRLGRLAFLAIFFFAGLAGALASLLAHPYLACYGASGAIAGLIGVTFVIHGLRLRTLSIKARWKFAAVAFVTLSTLWPTPVFDEVDYQAHLAGLAVGFLFGLAHASGILSRPRPRYALSAATLLILLTGFGWAKSAGAYVSLLQELESAENKQQTLAAHDLASGLFRQYPHRPDVLLFVVRTFESDFAFPEEAAAAKAGLALAPRDPHMLYHLANAEMNLGQCDDAEALRQQLMQIDNGIASPLSEQGCYDARYPGPILKDNGSPNFGVSGMHTYNQIAARLGPAEELSPGHYRWRRGFETLCIHTRPNGAITQSTETNDRHFSCDAKDRVSPPPTTPGPDVTSFSSSPLPIISPRKRTIGPDTHNQSNLQSTPSGSSQ